MASSTCDRCGRYAVEPRDARRFGVMVAGKVTAERLLCLACLDVVLGVVTVTLRRLPPAPPAGLTGGRT